MKLLILIIGIALGIGMAAAVVFLLLGYLWALATFGRK